MAQLRNAQNPFGQTMYGTTEGGYDQPPMPEADPNANQPPQVGAVPEAGAPPPGKSAPMPTTNPYDYEGFRTGWLTAGFGNKTSPEQLAQHAAKWGVTLRGGDKAYDPQGNFIADLVGDVGGRSTIQFLRGTGGTGKVPKGGVSPRGIGPAYDTLDGGGSVSSHQTVPGGKAKPGQVKVNPKTGKPVKGKPKVVNSHGPGSGAPPTAPGGPAAPPVAPPPDVLPGPTSDGPSGNPDPNAVPDMNSILKKLQEVYDTGGKFNQGLVDNRVSSANDAINRSRKSRLATNRAAMAERGILNSQDPASKDRMDEELFDVQAGAVRDIYGDESGKADARMMQALSSAAGLSSEQARQVIDKYRADNEKAFNEGNLALGGRRLALDDRLGSGRLKLDTELGRGNLALGRGQLALGNKNANNQYNLGIGGLGLDRDRLNWDMTSGSTDQLIKLLQSYMGGAQSTR